MADSATNGNNTAMNASIDHPTGGSSHQAQNERSGTHPHTLQNVVIDIESEDLTYNQARAIRMQIQKDVDQLANRVRMLRQEEQRALKKIGETKRKTYQIRELQAKNDEKYKVKLFVEEKGRIDEEHLRKSQIESRIKSQKDTTAMANKVRAQKLQSVHEVREVKDKARVDLSRRKLDEVENYQMRNRQLAYDKRVALTKQNDFIRNKVQSARVCVGEEQLKMQQQIADHEKEAQELERLEADLLQKLQQTQQNEKVAFSRLESAMVDASIPKKMRKMAGASATESNMSLGGNNAARWKSSEPGKR